MQNSPDYPSELKRQDERSAGSQRPPRQGWGPRAEFEAWENQVWCTSLLIPTNPMGLDIRNKVNKCQQQRTDGTTSHVPFPCSAQPRLTHWFPD